MSVYILACMCALCTLVCMFVFKCMFACVCVLFVCKCLFAFVCLLVFVYCLRVCVCLWTFVLVCLCVCLYEGVVLIPHSTVGLTDIFVPSEKICLRSSSSLSSSHVLSFTVSHSS